MLSKRLVSTSLDWNPFITMSKKLLSLILAAACAGVVGSRAQEVATPAEAPDYSVTVAPSFVSQYMFRGVRLGGASFQPYVEFDSSNWGLGVWSSFPFKAEDTVSDPELDVYGFYTVTINDSLSVVPGFTWYNYPHAVDGAYQSTFEPSVALNYTVAGVKLTPKLYYDVVLDGATYELTAAYALPLTAIGTELDFTATAGTYLWKDSADADPKLKNWGDYWQVGAAMPFKVTAKSTLTVGAAYVEGRNNYYKSGSDHKEENSEACGRGVVTVTYAYTF